jgi:hypothetical protein
MAESDADLQKQLDSFSDYCDIWRLKVNVEKSKIVEFTEFYMNPFNYLYVTKSPYFTAI